MCPFVGLSLPMFFFSPFIMLFVWVVHVHFIKVSFRIVIGAPPPILNIPGNIFIWFIETTRLNIVNLLKIILVGVPSFSVGVSLSYVTSSSLYFFKDRSFILL